MDNRIDIKNCIICGCLGVLIVTHTGPVCKKCLYEIHKYPHLPHGGMIYDWPINDYISRSTIEATTTGSTAVIVSGTIIEVPIKYIDTDEN